MLTNTKSNDKINSNLSRSIGCISVYGPKSLLILVVLCFLQVSWTQESSWKNQHIFYPNIKTTGHQYSLYIKLRDKGPHLNHQVETLSWQNAPLYPEYLSQIVKCGGKIRSQLKWQNAVGILASAPALPCLASKTFILEKIGYLDKLTIHKEHLKKTNTLAPLQLTEIRKLTGLSRLDYEPKKAGEGVKIALIDDGFNLNTTYLSHLSTKVYDHYDFVKNEKSFLNETNSHGNNVLSILSGMNKQVIGIVPYAQLLLYRSEDEAGEDPYEEDLVASAIERAVDSGAQIINISLGYRYDFDQDPDHPFSYFDGAHSPASIAAGIAAERGVLVVVAMGNEGLKTEPTLSSPADAKDILAVGAMSNLTKPCIFTSSGPSADGRPKPEISAPGCPVATGSGQEISLGSGTSYSAPLITGLAALLFQNFPHVRAPEVRKALMSTAYGGFDAPNRVGAGMVQIDRAFLSLSKKPRRVSSSPPIFFNSYLGLDTLDIYKLDGSLYQRTRRTQGVFFTKPNYK